MVTFKNILPMKVELKCMSCSNMFITDYKHRDKKFCDRACYFEYAKKNKLLGKEKDESVREKRTCVQCGNHFTERKKHERKLCSNECRVLWNQNEENKKNRINNSKQTMYEKYGVDSLFKLDEFKKNKDENFIKKYGVRSPMHLQKFVDKLKNTFKIKHLKNLLPKLDEQNLELLDDYKQNKNGNTSQSYRFKCKKCENIFSSTLLGSGKIPICRKCYPITKNSSLEQKIKDFLNLNKIIHIDADRKILNGKEIDIFLPEYSLGIEVNGNYFHSEISGEKPKLYHIEKTIQSVLSQNYTYGGGNNLDDVAWHYGNSAGAESYWGSGPNYSAYPDGRGTWPVGQKLPNELGLYDMSGNVGEWCDDLVSYTYESWSPGGGMITDFYQIQRGGSFTSQDPEPMSNVSILQLKSPPYWVQEAVKTHELGFRIVYDVEP